MPFASKRLLLVIFLAIVIRVAHLAMLWHSPALTVPIIDSRYYNASADSLALGKTQPAELFFMSPLYPYVLSFLYRSFGADPHVAVVFQGILGVVVVFLMYRLGTRLFDERVGLLAALLTALYRPFVYYEGVLLSAVLILCLNGTALLFLLNPKRKPIYFVAGGGLLGLSALARPNILLFAVLAFFFLLFKSERRLALWWILGLALILAPMTIRNYRVSGQFVLTTVGLGMNFYAGNNPGAEGIYSEAPFIRSAEPEFENKDYLAEAVKRTGDNMDLTQASNYWFKQGILFILERPGRYISLLSRKFFLFFHETEIPNNLSMYAAMAFSPF